MIDRYMPADFEEIWSEENMYRTWLRVELEVCRVLAEKGWIPGESMAIIEQKADFSVARIKEIENITHHDLIAFTTSVAEFVGPDSRYIHWGLTSTDVVDTARGLQLKQASEKILAAMDDLRKAIKERAMEHRKTLMMGRTHGVHAEVTTFGLKLAVWYDEMARNRERMERAAETRFGRKNFGRRRHVCPSRSGRGGDRLRADGIESGSGIHPDAAARPARRVPLHDCDHRSLAG